MNTVWGGFAFIEEYSVEYVCVLMNTVWGGFEYCMGWLCMCVFIRNVYALGGISGVCVCMCMCESVRVCVRERRRVCVCLCG